MALICAVLVSLGLAAADAASTPLTAYTRLQQTKVRPSAVHLLAPQRRGKTSGFLDALKSMCAACFVSENGKDRDEGGHNYMFDADVVSSPDQIIITADLPGLKRNDLTMQVNNEGLLTISGAQKQAFKSPISSESNSRYVLRERAKGHFRRSFHLPEAAKLPRIRARMRDGVLEVKVPLNVECTRERVVKIR
ncbi:unnamed protein product [Vitrella brassicaformis CCMP3155]|uniref:SHSP domain-containing protein n=2 Tax=Vitrella brassicaformis TaxID=1169539 RepID=A0A0G4G3H5_VITBC|nr:unnamed protein product [Vitrella brassicaformis CCMP3155]|eukprot:CEM22834.1 unnamed protein product [Vitrella brassicaformis CCMP3155]